MSVKAMGKFEFYLYAAKKIKIPIDHKRKYPKYVNIR